MRVCFSSVQMTVIHVTQSGMGEIGVRGLEKPTCSVGAIFDNGIIGRPGASGLAQLRVAPVFLGLSLRSIATA